MIAAIGIIIFIFGWIGYKVTCSNFSPEADSNAACGFAWVQLIGIIFIVTSIVIWLVRVAP